MVAKPQYLITLTTHGTGNDSVHLLTSQIS